MKIDAAQHVSGILTSKQSPKGRAGYQRLFYTYELLAQEEMRVIEQLAQYSSVQNGKAKWQSYRLSAQRHVITRIIPIAEPDEFGRRGRFFTHSLIFDAPGGRQVDEVLFDLLHPRNFLSSFDKLLASDGFKTGHTAPRSIDVTGDWRNEAERLLRNWPGEQLSQLYMLMSDPCQLTEQGQSVALLGSEAQILDALKVAFLLTPPNARKCCSFDTNNSGREGQSEMIFWGRGVSEAGGASYVIDAAHRQITIPDSSPLRANGFSPEQVSAPLRHAIVSRLNQPSERMLSCLLNRNYRAFICEPIYQALLRGTNPSLTASDLELLTPLRHRHHGLDLLLALKSKNESQRLQSLATMDSSSYKERIKELRTLSDFRPWQVFSPVFMPIWFDLFRGAYSMEDLTYAIAQVAEHGSTQDRGYVEEIHEYLDPAQRQALGQWLKASPHRLERLQAALDKPLKTRARTKSAGKSNSFLRRFLHPFAK